MKKLMITTVVLLFFVILVGCTSTPPTPEPRSAEIPWDHLFFDIEGNPSKVGSYVIIKPSGVMIGYQGAEWTALEKLFKRTVYCFDDFYYTDEDSIGLFFAKENYKWVEVEYKGSACLELKKK